MSAELAPYALDPFGPSANPSAYVACEASERARAILERSLDEGRVAAVMGPPGHGKTLLLACSAAASRSGARRPRALLHARADELFAIALNEIGVSRPDLRATCSRR
jgi:ABC-type lipoprotein export system ATPase subunit